MAATRTTKKPKNNDSASSTKYQSGYKGTELELKAINTIRTFCADMVQTAGSGHPGAPMGCAPLAYLLWGEVMKYSPSDPTWWNRDRFVLSNGHACALQYALLHIVGYDISLEDCKKLRHLDSRTPGHPENYLTSGKRRSLIPRRIGKPVSVGRFDDNACIMRMKAVVVLPRWP